MEAVCSRTEENGKHKGLDWIPGHIKKLPDKNLKMPHMGWNEVIPKKTLESNTFIEENNYKFSAGLELRIHGFSFYAYPTALEYEYHQALNDSEESGKHYLSFLFGF